jgi:hypothetical protein
MTTNLLFIGDLDVHESDFLPFLAAHGYNVTVINTSCYAYPKFPRLKIGTGPVHNLYEYRRIRFVFKSNAPRAWMVKAAPGAMLERAGFTFAEIRQILTQEDADIVYGSWGSIGLPELRFIRKFNIPIIYEFLTYPVGFTKLVEKVENFFNRSIINSLAGRVFPSSRMLNYMERTFDLRQGNNIVFTESYSKRCFYKKRLRRLSVDDGEPHLVFIGADEKYCNIIPQIEKMLQKKIHVHVCETTGIKNRLHISRFKDYFHVFERASSLTLFDGSFATFMTQFDACLVTYDLRRATSTRLLNSVPNRFSFAITAGIPFVMPRSYLKSCEDIVKKHQIGFAYANYNELKNKLDDKDLMNYYQHNAVVSSNNFTLERNFEKIDRFFRKITR